MKKPMQNVLAQNSRGDIAYICSKCGKIIDKEATVCIHCGARLGDIKCPFCHFTGSVKDFARDTCPRCGRNNLTQSPPLPDKAARKNALKSNPGKKEPLLSRKIFWALFMLLLVTIFYLIYTFLTYFDLY